MRQDRLFPVALLLFLALTAPIVAGQTTTIPQRTDIEDRYKWRLEDIYPDSNAWLADYKRVQDQMGLIGEFEGKLGESAENLYQCLNLRDSLGNILDRIYVYAYMKKDEDTRVSYYQELSDRASVLSAQYGQAVSFIRPEIISILDQKLETFLAQNDRLRLYKFYIENIIRLKPHILSPEEESILALSRIATRGPSNVFDMIDNADISFPKIKDSKGRQIELTHERYYKLLESPDRRLRRDASKAYADGYLNYVNTLGASLSASVNGDWFYAQTRHYKSTLEADLDNDNIPTAVYDNLVATVDANLAPLHKWTSIRKKALKLDKIYPYDLSVPLVIPASEDIPYDSAVTVIEKALAPLGANYINDLKKGFESGWIDVYETEGKGSGAYSWGAYSTHPYVLLNYNNSIDNFFTVAHEMGHALHSLYTHQSQPYVYEDYPTFVAEVASTTNEALLINYLLDHTTDRKERMYLINYYIEQIIGTFYTQVMFSEFEKAIHDQVEQGGALSAESMRKIYGDLYRKYWGPELTMEDWNDLGGLRISHFYSSYYVFQYATSYAAAQSISQEILSGDETARQSYLAMLTLGGSRYPVDQLKVAGVDMTQPDAVDATVTLFSGLVDEMDRLLQEK